MTTNVLQFLMLLNYREKLLLELRGLAYCRIRTTLTLLLSLVLTYPKEKSY
jgi:hypothetical protein